MKYYEKLSNNFFSVYLKQGDIETRDGHCMDCYFIVERIQDEAYIEKRVRQLLAAGCTEYCFFGKYAQKWSNAVALWEGEAAVKAAYGISAMTCVNKTMREFTDRLAYDLSVRTFIPTDRYLIYDDQGMYETALKQLKDKEKARGPRFRA